MFEKLQFSINHARQKHFLREYDKTNNDKFLEKADRYEGANLYIQLKHLNPKQNTYSANLHIHK